MYSSSDATTWAARYFFMSFIVLVGLLFSQLFISMIMTLISEADQLNSIRLCNFLRQFFATCNGEERQQIEQTLTELSKTLGYLQATLDCLSKGADKLPELFHACKQECCRSPREHTTLKQYVKKQIARADVPKLLAEHPWLSAMCWALDEQHADCTPSGEALGFKTSDIWPLCG